MSAIRAIAEPLRSSPAIVAATAAVGDDRPAWVVGGAVRDAALGRPVVDADLAVEAGAERDAARRVARAGYGNVFQLSARFGTWRAQARDRSWHVDVSRLRAATIEADLGLRDFTVNAVAVPLADLGATPLDPSGGLADLERSVLRAVSARSFADDPLRLLRAARLGAALGFELDPETVALARAEAARAGEPAGERQLAELRLLVGGPDPLRGLRLLDELGAADGVLPELAGLRGVVQTPNHHLDVYDHTIEVLEQLLAAERDLDTYAGGRGDDLRALLAEPLGDGFTRGEALRLGAVLHDVAKPATRREEDGRISFRRHDEVGAELVGTVCSRLQAGRALTRYVQALTRHHLRLGFMVPERPLSRDRLYDYLSATGDVAPDVTLLTVADRLAARGHGPIAAPEMVAAHLDLVREVMPAALDWHRDGPPGLPVRGDELARAAGIEPGAAVGAAIEDLRRAVFTGEVRTREDAIARAQADAGGAD